MASAGLGRHCLAQRAAITLLPHMNILHHSALNGYLNTSINCRGLRLAGLHAAPFKGLLEMYSKKVAFVNASSSCSVVGFATAPSAEVTGLNPSENRVRFWFAKVASLNRTWVLLVFETHNFGTGLTNDYGSLTCLRVRTRS